MDKSRPGLRCSSRVIVALAIALSASSYTHGSESIPPDLCADFPGLHACETHTDCVVVDDFGPCCCAMGGHQQAVNAELYPLAELACGHCSSYPAYCIALYNCSDYGAGCEDGTCVLTLCGDGNLEAGEECDDGNREAEDGCSQECVGEFCAHPVSAPGRSTAADALYVLRAATGAVPCDACVCDADGNGTIGASDALSVLVDAVGLAVRYACPPCP